MENHTLNRRKFMVGTAALSAVSLTGAIAKADSHAHHHHHHQANKKDDNILKAIRDCLAAANACEAHCLALIKAGDTSIADCHYAVVSMIPVCRAFEKLLSLDSPRKKEFATLCNAFCQDCEKECRAHEDKHAECKACAQACARVQKALTSAGYA